MLTIFILAGLALACLLLMPGVSWTIYKAATLLNANGAGTYAVTGASQLVSDANNTAIGPALAGTITGGTITLNASQSPQTISTNNRLDVYWTIAGVTYCRRGCTVGAVSGAGNVTVPVTVGYGTSLPTGGQAVQCMVPYAQAMAINGSNLVALAAYIKTTTPGAGPPAFQFDFNANATTEYFSPLLLQGSVFEWDSGLGTTNPLGSNTVATVYCSHNDTVNTWTMEVAALTTP